jgi:hypothetical protein
VSLRFPTDLVAWQRWQQRRHPLRRIRSAVGGRDSEPAPTWALHTAGGDPSLLVAVDSVHGTHAIALLEPLHHLDPARVAVLAPTDISALLPPAAWSIRMLDSGAGLLPFEPRTVLAAGDFLPVGAYGSAVADRSQAEFVAVQHGLLTPYAPPLARSAHLLAFSEADAAYWSAGRDDVRTFVVGSQLLWSAAQAPVTVDPDAPPVYLGQLHAAELSRSRLARAAVAFCRAHDATYRPHPSERDRVSRLLHAAWRRRGVRVDAGSVPLAELTAPVVSVFSTGVLEAAARGLPAWGDLPDAPAWLREFWERYDMRPYGGEPTPAPRRPDVEPALAIARLLETW